MNAYDQGSWARAGGQCGVESDFTDSKNHESLSVALESIYNMIREIVGGSNFQRPNLDPGC